MKITIGKELNGFSGFLYEKAVQQIAKSYSPYHAVELKGHALSQGERTHSDRWKLIAQVIRETQSATMLDIGCAEGYFVTRAAKECGCFSLGVDGDVRRLALANASAALNNVAGAGFMYADVTPEFLDSLPQFDGILFMSVLHHVMYEHGVDYARDFMRRLRPKAKRFIIFDMGQSNEVENAWASLLPDMGTDPHAWIARFLEEAGFSEVRKLAETDSYNLGPAKRALFRLAV